MMTDKEDKDPYTRRHGGPYDRGSADAYYRRKFSPHYYTGDTYSSTRIEKENMTEAEIEAYKKGFGEQDDFKEW